jgi:hypothetical protein
VPKWPENEQKQHKMPVSGCFGLFLLKGKPNVLVSGFFISLDIGPYILLTWMALSTQMALKWPKAALK